MICSPFNTSRLERPVRGWLMTTALLLISALGISAGQPNGWSKFRGAFFEIGIPPGFTAKGQPDSAAGQVSAVRMWNAAKKVEFYVFSPQWNGTADALSLVPGREVLKSRETKREGKVQVVELEIAARDGSYTRFVVSRTNDETNTNLTWGIRVPNMKVYAEVRPTYLRWKETLQQFAD